MILELRDIIKSYTNTTSGKERLILNGINLEIKVGDSISIVGPSGCGKSTLLNIMGSMDSASSGKVIFNGEDIGHLDSKGLTILRKKKIGFVFQQHHLLPQLTLLENVLLPCMEEKDKKRRNDFLQNALKLLDEVGLSPLKSNFPHQLSVGECQRAAVVRALINDPVLLLADEPTGSLDEESSKKLVDLLLKFNQEKELALVMVTHAQNLAIRMNRPFQLINGLLVD